MIIQVKVVEIMKIIVIKLKIVIMKLIPKEKIENYIYDEKEIFYKIQSNNDLPTLTSKIRLIEAFDNWKYLNQIMNIPSKYPKNRWRKVQLKKMTFQKQNEINHLP